MAGLKDTLSKGLATLNVKTGTFMEENKIRTYISNLEHEINNIYPQIGRAVYDQWRQTGAADMNVIAPMCAQINEKLAEIGNQKAKIEELNRQAEQILGQQNQAAYVQPQPVYTAPAPGAAPAAPSGETVICPSCGGTNVKGYKFCMKCGQPLP